MTFPPLYTRLFAAVHQLLLHLPCAAHTRRAYRQDIENFMAFAGLRLAAQFREVTRAQSDVQGAILRDSSP
jgi:hypothetical protein